MVSDTEALSDDLFSNIGTETHAEIIGGLISGCVVIAGIFLAELLARRRRTIDEIREATHKVALGVPLVFRYASPVAPGPSRFEYGTAAWARYEDLMTALARIDVATRRVLLIRTDSWLWKWTGTAKARLAADELLIRILAVYGRADAGLLVDELQMASATEVVNQLTAAVFSNRRPADSRLEEYVQDGPPREVAGGA